MKTNKREPDCLERYGVPVDLILACFGVIVFACAVMLGIEIVKDVLGL